MSVYTSDSDAVWVGIFAGAVGHHLNHPDDDILRQTYRDFLRSPLGADPALREALPPLPPRGRAGCSPGPRPRVLQRGRR